MNDKKKIKGKRNIAIEEVKNLIEIAEIQKVLMERGKFDDEDEYEGCFMCPVESKVYETLDFPPEEQDIKGRWVECPYPNKKCPYEDRFKGGIER